MAPASTGLSRETIVAFAMQVADREGLEAVSFRRLADHFGVTPMALYHHVRDKAHLLAEMSETFLSELVVPPSSRDWPGSFAACCSPTSWPACAIPAGRSSPRSLPTMRRTRNAWATRCSISSRAQGSTRPMPVGSFSS